MVLLLQILGDDVELLLNLPHPHHLVLELLLKILVLLGLLIIAPLDHFVVGLRLIKLTLPFFPLVLLGGLCELKRELALRVHPEDDLHLIGILLL